MPSGADDSLAAGNPMPSNSSPETTLSRGERLEMMTKPSSGLGLPQKMVAILSKFLRRGSHSLLLTTPRCELTHTLRRTQPRVSTLFPLRRSSTAQDSRAFHRVDITFNRVNDQSSCANTCRWLHCHEHVPTFSRSMLGVGQTTSPLLCTVCSQATPVKSF
jgi:hypothetical protein